MTGHTDLWHDLVRAEAKIEALEKEVKKLADWQDRHDKREEEGAEGEDFREEPR